MIQTEQKKTVLKAIDELGRRVTAADVAAKTGLPVLVATSELNNVALETNGHLEVSKTGDIAYSFSPAFQAAYLTKGFQRNLEFIFEKLLSAAYFLLKISFGVMLVVSFIIILILIIAVMLAMQSRDRDDDRGGFDFNFSFFDYMILRDLLCWGTYSSASTYVDYDRPTSFSPKRSNFLLNCFSFLFGDGNPNAHLSERQWQLVAQTIKKHGNVITAEQLAPYTGADPHNEDGVLPVLVRFNGKPEVTDDGHILYTFPALQITVARSTAVTQPFFLQEFPWRFTTTDAGSLTPVYILALVNFFGSWWLLLQSRYIPLLMELHALIVALVIYGTFFVIVPLGRWAVLQYLNRRIEARNQKRKTAADLLSNPDADLIKKLSQAQAYRLQDTQINQSDIVYTSDKDLLEQEFKSK